jgi:uncharacterized protein Smg (DUF494 family)
MFERIIEIIVYLISELQDKRGFDDIDMGELQELGYTKSEISTAFSWLADKIDVTERVYDNFTQPSAKSFRVLHSAEEEMFTKEAWGLLIQLQTLGLLNPEHTESIIEKALMSGFGEISAPLLRSIVAGLVFNAPVDGTSSFRYMLDGSDTIN